MKAQSIVTRLWLYALACVFAVICAMGANSNIAYAQEEDTSAATAVDTPAVVETDDESDESAAVDNASSDELDENATDPTEEPTEETATDATDAATDAADTAPDATDASSDASEPAVADEEASAETDADAALDDETATVEQADNSTQSITSSANAATSTAKATTTAAKTTAAKTTAVTLKNGWYTISTLLNSALKVQVKDSQYATGTKIVLSKLNYTTGQAFYFEKVSGGYYRILTGAGKGSRIYVSDNGKVSVGQAAYKNTMFSIVKENGYYRIINVATGKALAFSGKTAKSGISLTTKTNTVKYKTEGFTLTKRPGIVRNGVYIITSTMSSSRALAPKNGSRSKGASATIASNSRALWERYSIQAVSGKTNVYTIENIATGYLLTADSSSVTFAKASASSKNQMWKAIGLNKSIIFKNLATGKVIQPSNGSTKAGTSVVSAKEVDKRKQCWRLSHSAAIGSGIYELDTKAGSGLALGVSSSSTSSGAAVKIITDSNISSQRWIYDASTKTLSNANSGLVLAIKGGTAKSGAKLVQSSYTGDTTQQWKFTHLGGGKFRITSVANSSLSLTVGGTTNGSSTKLASSANAKTQYWHPLQAKGGTTSYITLAFTIAQMAQWQKSNNPYISDYSTSYIESVLNPSNGSKYKFLDLTKSTGVSATALNNFINTYGSSGQLAGLGSAFVSAAKKYNLNEVYLLAHAILESGWGSSTLANGYYYSGGWIDGTYYKAGTYYNFYGIGAYDSSPLSGGRKMAIINGWNSRTKAVTGAAKWIAENYVYRSEYAQKTLYNMKWDLLRSKANKTYGWHQYATDPDWADKIGNLMGQCFSMANASVSYTFIKPKYK